MSTLAVILVATAAGSVLSLFLAAILAFSARPSWVPVLVSYAIGALLGASLLEVLPEAVGMGGGHQDGRQRSAWRHPAVLLAGKAGLVAALPRRGMRGP